MMREDCGLIRWTKSQQQCYVKGISDTCQTRMRGDKFFVLRIVVITKIQNRQDRSNQQTSLSLLKEFKSQEEVKAKAGRQSLLEKYYEWLRIVVNSCFREIDDRGLEQLGHERGGMHLARSEGQLAGKQKIIKDTTLQW